MRITVASGKGGTGKTTVATSLSVNASAFSPLFLDCDVEAPNAHHYLKPTFENRIPVMVVPPGCINTQPIQ